MLRPDNAVAQLSIVPAMTAEPTRIVLVLPATVLSVHPWQ